VGWASEVATEEKAFHFSTLHASLLVSLSTLMRTNAAAAVAGGLKKNSDATSGVITNSHPERVADSLSAFEKYCSVALAVPPSYFLIYKNTLYSEGNGGIPKRAG
jgi:hypothetical protein